MSATAGVLDKPGTHIWQGFLDAIAAATATADHVIFRATGACTVKKVVYTPNTANTGADTNYHSLSVIHRGTDGLGTTAMGTAVDYVSGTNDVAAVPRTLYNNTTGQAVAAGGVVVIKHTKTGTGVALSAGHVSVEFEPN